MRKLSKILHCLCPMDVFKMPHIILSLLIVDEIDLLLYSLIKERIYNNCVWLMASLEVRCEEVITNTPSSMIYVCIWIGKKITQISFHTHRR